MFSSPSRSSSDSDSPRAPAFGAGVPHERAKRSTETRAQALTSLARRAEDEIILRNSFSDRHGGENNPTLARQAAAAARAYDVASKDPGPPDEPDVGSDFNTLRAVVTITRRIYDTKLLPQHSRTLNNSVLKNLLETTAMESNRTMKQLYPAYQKDDKVTLELQIVADAHLRKLKADIREYVDRMLEPRAFLQTELGASPFTAACNDALEYIKARGGAPAVIGDPSRAPQLQWLPATLANIIVSHADVRGNIIDAGRSELMNRFNWYNSSQHVWGASFPHGATWCDNYAAFEAAEAVMASGATEAQKRDVVNRLRQRLRTRPFPLEGPTQGKTATWRGADGPTRHGGGPTANEDWTALKEETGWDLFAAVKAALEKQATVVTSAPLTLFDIALLGGLHPRTFAMEEKARSSKGVGAKVHEAFERAPRLRFTFDTDVFFEQCMIYFDNLGKGDDLGETMFSTHLNTKSKHTSYMPFRRDRVSEALRAGLEADPGDLDGRRPVEFGAGKRAGDDGEDMPHSKRLRAEQLNRRAAHVEEEVNGPGSRIVDTYALERYCDACFERGVELYLRLMREMIGADLERVRAYDEALFPPKFLKPLAKYIGLTIQRAELMNPTLKSTSVSNNRENRRTNSWALTEARVQLAQYCGFKPEVELNGYALEGPLAAPTRDAPAAPPGWALTPGGPVWTKAHR